MLSVKKCNMQRIDISFQAQISLYSKQFLIMSVFSVFGNKLSFRRRATSRSVLLVIFLCWTSVNFLAFVLLRDGTGNLVYNRRDVSSHFLPLDVERGDLYDRRVVVDDLVQYIRTLENLTAEDKTELFKRLKEIIVAVARDQSGINDFRSRIDQAVSTELRIVIQNEGNSKVSRVTLPK